MNIQITRDNVDQLVDQAMSDREIKVFYQPKYDAVTGRIVSAEALARWVAADGDVIPPIKFIPFMEELGSITALDWYVLKEVCVFLSTELKNSHKVVPISVNFSRVHTAEVNFSAMLCDSVDGFGIPHDMIEVEITESAMATDEKHVIPFVHSIREAGFAISIDDFGSGLSSLNFVKDVPANEIKIDKSLLSGNCENEKERIVLESIFDFAHRLKMITVAEGVETREQLGFLRTCGCKLIQGYLFAKPMPEEQFKELLSNESAVEEVEDILTTQAPATASQLLLDVIFSRYPLVIMSNLSRDSFYMMAYENFHNHACPSTGIYSDLIRHGTSTMHPEDQKLFADTFDVGAQLSAYKEGERSRSVVTRQLGDDGVYRRVEITNYYVKNPSVNDVLAITLSRAIE